MVTHQLQVRCRPVKVHRSETDVLPLSHPTNCLSRIIDFSECRVTPMKRAQQCLWRDNNNYTCSARINILLQTANNAPHYPANTLLGKHLQLAIVCQHLLHPVHTLTNLQLFCYSHKTTKKQHIITMVLSTFASLDLLRVHNLERSCCHWLRCPLCIKIFYSTRKIYTYIFSLLFNKNVFLW